MKILFLGKNSNVDNVYFARECELNTTEFKFKCERIRQTTWWTTKICIICAQPYNILWWYIHNHGVYFYSIRNTKEREKKKTSNFKCIDVKLTLFLFFLYKKKKTHFINTLYDNVQCLEYLFFAPSCCVSFKERVLKWNRIIINISMVKALSEAMRYVWVAFFLFIR